MNLESNPSTLGVLLTIFNVKSNVPVEGLHKFLERVLSFSLACRDVTGESGDVKDCDLLKLVGPLYHDLHRIQFVQLPDPQSDEPDYQVICTEAVLRLLEKVNNMGMKWIKSQMENLDSDSAKNIATLSGDVLKEPTNILRDAVITCGLINRSSKLDSMIEGLGNECGVAAIADLSQWYVQADCANKSLMTSILPESVSACERFMKVIDSKLGDLCKAFMQNVGKLEALYEKYKFLGLGKTELCCFYTRVNALGYGLWEC